MLSNSDTERSIPDALVSIPHGKKNTGHTDPETRLVVARFREGAGGQVKVVKGAMCE